MQRPSDREAKVRVRVPEIPLLIFARILQGDRKLLDALGLAESELAELRLLPSEALPRLLGQAGCGEIIDVRFDRQALRRFLRHLRADHRTENEIRTMIEAEASYPFMRHFYGFSYPMYYQYRRKVGLRRSRGRPAKPNFEAITDIEALLNKLELLTDEVEVGPFDLLAVHQLTGHALRDVWAVFRRCR